MYFVNDIHDILESMKILSSYDHYGPSTWSLHPGDSEIQSQFTVRSKSNVWKTKVPLVSEVVDVEGLKFYSGSFHPH